MKKIFSFVFLTLFLILPATFLLPSDVLGWSPPDPDYAADYIKEFKSTIVINKDSSLDITEKILWDFGNLEKHGIFRILPTFYEAKEGRVITPVKLASITDFSGRPLNYRETKERFDGTVTWKIGDADITVSGEQGYLIKYKVSGAIRTSNQDFDEFYWNLNGNFWEVLTAKGGFTADIVFPRGVGKNNVLEINRYGGFFGESKLASDTDYSWADERTLHIVSREKLRSKEGVTTSVTFPKGFVQPYKVSFLTYLWLLFGWGILLLVMPFVVLVYCFKIWLKYGRDIALHKTIAPEFAIPGGLNPMQMGSFLKNGKLKSQHISSGIINLAVKGHLTMEKTPKKGLLTPADTKLTLLPKTQEALTKDEKMLLDGIFGGEKEVLMTSLINKFYKHIPPMTEEIKKGLEQKKLFDEKGFGYQHSLGCLASIFASISFLTFVNAEAQLTLWIFFSLIATAGILGLFAFLMPKRTLEGAELLRQIKGFQLYMKTAEKYRQQFNEKENIFERFLPYAMLFGLTGLWVAKMKMIYGEQYFATYHPIWYVGSFGNGNFDVESFASQISSLSSSMASTMASSPSSSGSGGGGFSGGGGGGGGGGSW